MKRIWSLILAAAMLLSMAGCSNTEKDWQEQYDLGMRYLEEGDYEEAILAFSAAIEIDGSRPEAYIGRAEAYIATGDLEKALKDYKKAQRVAKSSDEDYEDLVDELEEIIGEMEAEIEEAEIVDVGGKKPLTKIKQYKTENGYTYLWKLHYFLYDSNGYLMSRTVETYSETGNILDVSGESYAYDRFGNVTGIWDSASGALQRSFTYDAEGKLLGWSAYGTEYIYSYDEQGDLLSQISADGYMVTEYTCENGRPVAAVAAYDDGTFVYTYSFTYDDQGRLATESMTGTYNTETEYLYDFHGLVAYYIYTDMGESSFNIAMWDASGTYLWSMAMAVDSGWSMESDSVVGTSGYLTLVEDNSEWYGPCLYEFYYGDAGEEGRNGEESTGNNWQKTEASDAYSLYKEYFYSHFSDSDIVYLADVTHDGVEDMLVVNFLDEYHATVYGHVFTVLDGEVVEIYTKQGSDYHAGGFFSWYLVPVPDSDYWNLASETFGMWQGIGVVTYREYLLTNEGYAIDVSYLELDSEEEGNHDSYGMVTEAAWSAYAAELNAELADCYRIYCSSSNGSGSKALDTNPASVFGQ